MNVVKGYNGIMDLDLTNVDVKHHKTLITEHLKDIDAYKIEQALLKPELRYENTVGRALKIMKYEDDLRKKYKRHNSY